jgi:PAS domain S-box-containing protein
MGDSADTIRPRKPSWLIVRGESLIGSIGLAIAAILLAMVGLAGWWSMRGQQEAWRFVRSEQVRVLGSVLSESAESMLAGNDLSALRRLIVEAKRQHGLIDCRITLPDGKIVADSDPTKITLVSLPQNWPSGPLDAAMDNTAKTGADLIRLNLPLLIKGRGAATLQIAAATTTSATRLWETAAGIGLIGAAGLAAMLIVYRRMRSRVVTLGLIRESLLASQGDVAGSRDAMTLRSDLGPEAAAWNMLLQENESLRKASVAERVKGTLGNRREGRSDLEHAYDALAVGVIVVDNQARIKHANGAAAVMLQAKRDAIVGQSVTSLIDDAAVKEVITAILAGSGQRRTMEVTRPASAGGGVCRIHIRPLRREDDGGALVTLEDITQQRVADAARNNFVAQATHELRTPLTNMRLCLENALEDQDSDPHIIREHFNTLNQETRRLERMVGEMLSVAQIEAGSLALKRDDVRLDKVFEELQADYKPQAAEKSLALTFDLPPKFPVLQADRDKLMVVLHNLLGNALKYTPAGGKVSVAVRADASRLAVDFSDTGIGISPTEQSRLFTKFYRAKDPRVEQITGSGLGLALAREIARLHGGDVTLQSELDKGSTFTLTLPLIAVQAKAA